MTDLYQQAPGSKGYGPRDYEVVRRMAPGAMLLWVVPVEPCEHGNTGEHVVRDPKRTYHPSELCAEVGGETP